MNKHEKRGLVVVRVALAITVVIALLVLTGCASVQQNWEEHTEPMTTEQIRQMHTFHNGIVWRT